MKPIQHNQHNFADQDFQQSLNQLKNIVQDNFISDKPNSTNQASHENVDIIDLGVWEDGVADIEQYLEQKTRKNN